jgi:UDP:flavonoid glycosyltransferase YjiC (YdhE family)
MCRWDATRRTTRPAFFDWGAGVRIGQRSTPDRIAAAVAEVIAVPRYRQAALTVADILALEAMTRPTAADEAEALLFDPRPASGPDKR